MKTYKIQYSKGHLVDVETNKRILLKRGGEFTLLGDDDQFEEVDKLNVPLKSKNAIEKYQSLTNKYEYIEKICSAGSRLVYRVGIKKKTSEDKNNYFLFDAILEEDLYLKSNDGKNPSLCDCLCYSKECLEGDLQMIEPVYGNSLNNLYSNLVAFYFPLQRSGACNAFDTFYIANDEDLNLENLKNKSHLSLRKMRSQIIEKYK